MSILRQKYNNIPIICLLRDSKNDHTLDELKEHEILKENSLKISNYSNKILFKSELCLLKEEIFYFIKNKLHVVKEM